MYKLRTNMLTDVFCSMMIRHDDFDFKAYLKLTRNVIEIRVHGATISFKYSVFVLMCLNRLEHRDGWDRSTKESRLNCQNNGEATILNFHQFIIKKN